VRVQHHDRLLADQSNLREALDTAPVLTETTFDRPASNGRPARTVEQQIKVVRVTLEAPSRPDRALPDVTVTALLATEAHPPAGEDPLDWLLLTNLLAETPEQAIEKLQWSVCRWQIEISFKVLKSGCRIEALQQLLGGVQDSDCLATRNFCSILRSLSAPDDALTSPESPNRLEVQVPLGARSWLYFLSVAGHRAALRQQDLHQRPLDCEPGCLSTQAKNKISRPHPFVCGPSRCPKLNVSTGTAGSASA
jgi:hypothetical protein